jgi:hypothetical protein
MPRVRLSGGSRAERSGPLVAEGALQPTPNVTVPSGGSRAERSGPLDAKGPSCRVGLQALKMALNRRAALFGRIGGGSRAERSGPLVAEGAHNPKRWAGLGLLSTGLVCPCHVLAGLVALVTGVNALSPAAQDGVHAVYVPLAVLAGAVLLRRR